MGTQPVRPETLEEQLVYWAIALTWAFWLVGGLYIVGAAFGYVLLMIYGARLFGVLNDRPVDERLPPVGVMLWIGGMLFMLTALVIGHFDFELGIGKTIKSSVGWAKGWALLAVFPLAGALLAIRPAVIYRACGHLGLQTLLLVPLFVAAGLAGLPKHLYTSPLSIIGGTGPEFFDVTLYAIDDTDGSLRWRFFAPWATAAAFCTSMMLFFALYERSTTWKIVGVVSALVVCWMAGSRSSIVAIPFVIGGVWAISNLHRPYALIMFGVAAAGLILAMDQLVMAVEDFQNAFNAARKASSRVREALNEIGFHRWYTEAFWFGHGTVEPGPHLVQFMPIGSHHTWYGLLFVKGLVGFLALAIPLGYSIIELSIKAQTDRVARSALSVVLAIMIFSFADNIEIVVYLIWPGLLIVGIGLRRRFFNPFQTRFASRYDLIDEVPSGGAYVPRPA